MITNIIVSEKRMQEFMKKRENNKINKLIDKYDRKLFIVKEKKYTVPVVEVVVGALFTLSS